MNQNEQLEETEQLRELEEKANKKKNNKLKYVLFQKAADGYLARQEYEHAYQLYEQALNTAKKMLNAKLGCQALIDLGSTADKMNEIDDAIDYYEQALEIALSIHDARTQSRISTKLGIVFAKIGDYDLADHYFEQARKTATIAWRAKSVQRQEQTTPQLLIEAKVRTGSKLPPTPRTRIETRNQINQVEQISTMTRKLTLFVGILLILVSVIIGTNIFFTPSRQAFDDIFIILLIIIIIIILPFLDRIYAFIYHEKRQD